MTELWLTPLTCSRLLVEGEEDAILHSVTKVRLELSGEARRLLRLFAEGSSPQAALEGQELSEESRAALLGSLQQLLEAGFLFSGESEEEFLRARGKELRDGQAQPLVSPSSPLLGAASSPEEAEVLFVGVPFEQAGVPGPGKAPEELRARSQLLAWRDPFQRAHKGVLDHSDGRTLLAGAALCDLGDVNFAAQESLERGYARIEAVARGLAPGGARPIFLGGDHSITLPILKGLEPPGGRMFVVHFDAHTDLELIPTGDLHHHGNFMDGVCRLESVAGVLQLGVRDLQPPWGQPRCDVRRYGARQLLNTSTEEVLAAIPAQLPCYLTIDLDVLDPTEFPATGSLVPGGLSQYRLLELVEAICAQRTVFAADLVEFAPRLDVRGVSSLLALQLLVHLSEALRRR